MVVLIIATSVLAWAGAAHQQREGASRAVWQRGGCRSRGTAPAIAIAVGWKIQHVT